MVSRKDKCGLGPTLGIVNAFRRLKMEIMKVLARQHPDGAGLGVIG
jgi:hypothetical protein